ncbi:MULTISPECIES: aldehyde dehydrogenase family protein [Streptomyces]|uniref:aldehyde dehydrogenase family protein n=1 Tax=Streptomyces TaxID=1883 RepID=UPI00109C987C|nr:MULTISPECIES: aldehyde dehydrogenase family protein [unclassified Streptomyces]MCE3029588.1 aldehyde dehydrogenase family protein [Streptomyces sp. CMSTAAHL-2]TGZ15033.1 hypothetical protein DV517_00060 [Streptomyces sp. S816]
MTTARAEIFSPVMPVIAYDTADEALPIADDSPHAAVYHYWRSRQPLCATRRIASRDVRRLLRRTSCA